jgi:hypothetical protein
MAYEEFDTGSVTTEVDAAEVVQLDQDVSPLFWAAMGRVATQKAQGFEGSVDPNGAVTAFDSAVPQLEPIDL